MVLVHRWGNFWMKTSGPGALEEPRKVAQLVLAPHELTQATIDIREFAINCDSDYSIL